MVLENNRAKNLRLEKKGKAAINNSPKTLLSEAEKILYK